MRFFVTLFCFVSLLLLTACDQKKADDRGTLVINTEPAGAMISISGTDCGKSPVSVRKLPGFCLIKAEKDGYETAWNGVMMEGKRKKEVLLQLKPVTSSIMLKATADIQQNGGRSGKKNIPVAAEVFFQGKKYGQTPLVIKDLKSGVYTAALKAPGYAQTEISWTVDSKRPQMKIVKLFSNTGIIQIIGGPEKATVTINGTVYGNTPCEVPLEQGNYTVEVSAPGYHPFTRDVSLVSNAKVEVRPVLTELPGTLEIKSNPAGANVTVNGKQYGTAPLTVEGVKAGKYRIEFSMKGFDTDVQECGVAPGQTLSVTGILTSNLGGIEFVTVPSGVTVYLDNKKIGITEPDPEHRGYSKVFRINGLQPGQHTLSFFHKMATPSRRDLRIMVEKNKNKRLEQNVELWIANARIIHKIGSQYVGRIVSENEEYIKFEHKPGSRIDYKRSELKTIERFPGRE